MLTGFFVATYDFTTIAVEREIFQHICLQYTLLTILATLARALGLMGYKECHVVFQRVNK